MLDINSWVKISVHGGPRTLDINSWDMNSVRCAPSMLDINSWVKISVHGGPITLDINSWDIIQFDVQFWAFGHSADTLSTSGFGRFE